jgi:drug/metabolite transporter (DMT)-like permease
MICRKALDGKGVWIMILLCAIWGLQQIAIKAAAPDMPPVLQMALRSGLAALLVGIYLRMKGLGLLPGNGAWLSGLGAGVLFTLEYLFVAEGLCFTNASHMVTMLYTAPIFAALGLHFLIPEERLHPIQWLGVALAFCGIVVAFYDSIHPQGLDFNSILFGDFLGLLAGISWGATTVVIRKRLSEIPAAQTAFIQLLVCFCMLLPGAILTGRFILFMSNIVWASLIYQVLIVCFVGMLTWFWMLRVYPASQLGILSFLAPVFGIVFGVVLLNEPVEPNFILGAVLVIMGITIVSGWQWIAKHVRYSIPYS